MHFVAALDGDAGDKFEVVHIKVTFLNLNNYSFINVFKIFFKLKKIIKKNKIDIVHSHHRFFDFVVYILSFFCKIKRVTSVQSFVFGKKLFSYKSPVLLAAGESVKKHLINYFKINEERIIVFNNFIDVEEIPGDSDVSSIINNLSIPENSFIFGYIGRFSVKEKGIDILIEAFNKFRKLHRNCFLVMVGGGEDIKKISIPENVITLESKENIFEYYKMFDCLILPSRIDPFPLTVLEAGMMKIPFIGADVDGISEIIEDNTDGLLFPKENVTVLTEKMEMFFKEKDFAKKCACNLNEKVLKKYNRKIAIEKLNKIYEKL